MNSPPLGKERLADWDTLPRSSIPYHINHQLSFCGLPINGCPSLWHYSSDRPHICTSCCPSACVGWANRAPLQAWVSSSSHEQACERDSTTSLVSENSLWHVPWGPFIFQCSFSGASPGFSKSLGIQDYGSPRNSVHDICHPSYVDRGYKHWFDFHSAFVRRPRVVVEVILVAFCLSSFIHETNPWDS